MHQHDSQILGVVKLLDVKEQVLLTVKRFFSKTETETANNASQATEHDVRVAACALFVEMARIDEKFTEAEMETILSIVQDRYGLSREQADALVAAPAAG